MQTIRKSNRHLCWRSSEDTLLRRFSSSGPALNDIQARVREQRGAESGGVLEAVATCAVRVSGGGSAALRRRLASPQKSAGLAAQGRSVSPWVVPKPVGKRRKIAGARSATPEESLSLGVSDAAALVQLPAFAHGPP